MNHLIDQRLYQKLLKQKTKSFMKKDFFLGRNDTEEIIYLVLILIGLLIIFLLYYRFNPKKKVFNIYTGKYEY